MKISNLPSPSLQYIKFPLPFSLITHIVHPLLMNISNLPSPPHEYLKSSIPSSSISQIFHPLLFRISNRPSPHFRNWTFVRNHNFLNPMTLHDECSAPFTFQLPFCDFPTLYRRSKERVLNILILNSSCTRCTVYITRVSHVSDTWTSSSRSSPHMNALFNLVNPNFLGKKT